ncbi:MAG: hypothetical protein WBM69_14255 [Desulfobacterales bacterium]
MKTDKIIWDFDGTLLPLAPYDNDTSCSQPAGQGKMAKENVGVWYLVFSVYYLDIVSFRLQHQKLKNKHI